MCTTGALLLSAAVGYYLMLPKPHLIIYIEGTMIEFGLGWCFWLVLVAGGTCLFTGLVVSAIDLIWPHKFSTILEVYYGTPYDRQVDFNLETELVIIKCFLSIHIQARDLR